MVAGYPILGNKKRILNDTNSVDDTTDAGDTGASHEVTVLCEIVPGDALVAAHVPLSSWSRQLACERAFGMELLDGPRQPGESSRFQ